MKFLPSPRLVRFVGAGLLALASLSASAFSRVVVFGDSLSDDGNNALVIGTDPGQVITGNAYVPTFPYASGVYSDGAVWATDVAAALGLPLLPSLAGGTDFAYGGAETHGRGFPPSLAKQLTQYTATPPVDPANTLYVVEGGGNNARSALEAIAGGASPQRTIASTARRYARDVGSIVDTLKGLGALHVLVWNTPDIGVTPSVRAAGPDAAALGSQIAAAMNDALASRLAGVAGVRLFDTFGLLDAVAADPAAYGFTNASDACGAVVTCDPATWFFWDGIHPTSGGHAFIARQIGAIAAGQPARFRWQPRVAR